MFIKRNIKYGIVILIILISGSLFVQQTFYSIDYKLLSHERLQKNIEDELHHLKDNSDRNVDVKYYEKELDSVGKSLKPNEKPTIIKNYKDIVKHGFESVEQAEDAYFKTITLNTIHCNISERFGRSDDGGWDVCLMKSMSPRRGNCLVYSFGVNYIWEFDDELSTEFGCTVRTFDPSLEREPDELQRPSKVWYYKIGLGNENTILDNGWKMRTLGSLLRRFKEQNRIIDILKVDIEFSEWDSFEAILEEGLFVNVKQLLFETHTEEVRSQSTTLNGYIRFLTVWNRLYKLGFRQWKHHWNHFGNFQSSSGVERTCCYEHYLINRSFL